MKHSIYLISPTEDHPAYHSAEVVEHYGFAPAALVADLAIATVAALVPEDFDVTICDEHISPADLEIDAEFIAITGKCSQVPRMIELADEYRRRGHLVLIGGPHASLCPEQLRAHCDILVIGEIEQIAARLFDDLRSGDWSNEYRGNRVDLALSPMPRWDLYPNDRAMIGCVQTSRGCPFECEFCDVIQYVGRSQRHKSSAQVVGELDALYDLGYRGVFLADDNFTVYRRRTRELLTALKSWNDDRPDGRMMFTTQLSIDIAKDDDILQLMSDAGPFEVFIGLETPNEESLLETGKRQNIGVDLAAQVQRFYRHGISVYAGMIVGFDADQHDIFERQFQFAQRCGIPFFSASALQAPSATPLFDRMKDENRLVSEGEVGANTVPWSTNIIPKQMSIDDLLSGLKWLVNRMYHPTAFHERMMASIERLQIPTYAAKDQHRRSVANVRGVRMDATKVILQIAHLGPEEADMMSKIMKALSANPGARPMAMSNLFRYAQIRHMLNTAGLWDAHTPDRPVLSDAQAMS